MVAVAPLKPDSFYHIYLGASNRTILFASDDNFLQFLRLYSRLIEPIAETFAYCLLPNHFHFFLRIKTLREQVEEWYEGEVEEEAALGADSAEFTPLNPDRQFATLLAEHSATIQHLPPLITAPIQRILVSDNALSPHLIRYIHQNPTLHQQTDNFRTYRWSSYRALISRRPTRLAVTQVMEWFHGEEWFDEMHWIPVDETKIGYLILED